MKNIILKKKICKRCGKEKYIFARGMCKYCDVIVNPEKHFHLVGSNAKDMKDKAKKEKQKLVSKIKTKKESIASLKKKLDEVFSLYIRLRKADENGMVQCFTSGKIMHYKQSHCGHFVSRRHLATRWDEMNCQVQSVKENIFNQGNAPMFAVKLDEYYGAGTAKMLVEKSNNISKMGVFEYQLLIKKYTDLVNILKEKL